MTPKLVSSGLTALLLGGWFARPLQSQARSPSSDTANRPEFICDWTPGPPVARRLVVDLLLESGQFNRTPSLDDVRAVQAAGGRVLHTFHVAVLRAELDTAAVRFLVAGPSSIADAAYSVADTLSLGVRLQIFYKRAITNADESALRELGASDFYREPSPPVLAAFAPDSIIPRLQRLPGVAFVRAYAVVCGRPE